jgi:hypothetical protein
MFTTKTSISKRFFNSKDSDNENGYTSISTYGTIVPSFWPYLTVLI